VANAEAEKRRARLAAALRENLKRRKAHKRAAGSAPDAAKASAEPSGDALSPPKRPR